VSEGTAKSRLFYRIVLTDPPGEEDFKSYEELGKRPAVNKPEYERLLTGISVYSSLSSARKKAKGFPWKSRCYIAELALPESDELRLEQTEPGSKHYTLWGDEALVRASIVRIIPMRENSDDL
jgi:hypothetical protein